jgi:hypothetical protein
LKPRKFRGAARAAHSMPRPHAPKPLLALASAALLLSVVLLIVSYDTIAAATNVAQWPNTGRLSWAHITSCAGDGPDAASAPAGANAFTLHMFFMTLAFGFFGPASSVMYYVLEDLMRLNHDLVKWIHAAVQTAAVICSVLGFLQAYYANGAWCHFADHFRSLHSYVGITVLALYWLQGPLALLIFSNKSLLKPGTAARALFLRVHQVLGVGLT